MSLSAATICLMAEMGLSAEQIGQLARAVEQDVAEALAPKPRSANAERQAKFRARRAEEREGVTRNVTNNATHNVTPPLLDKEIPPTPPKEINPTPPPVRLLTKTNVPTPSPKAFDEFWLAYPRKVGKGAARKAFAKALGKVKSEDPRSTIMAALTTAKRAWADVDAQFIPHASTWLNQDRWEDEPFASGARPPDAADDELARAERLARVERMTPEERKAHYAAELEKWQSENPNLRAM